MNLSEIKERLPKDAMITDIAFEGSDIVIYTKSRKFFLEGAQHVKPIVAEIKKRIDIRPDETIRLPEEEARKKILEIAPKEAEIEDIVFEPAFGKVTIYAKKPGLVIGKNGSILTKIKEETCWYPETKRVPLIKSEIIAKIREIVHAESKYRQKFLNRIGQQIQLKKGDKEGWVRVSFLGAGREVGRSCLLVQTQKSRVMLDCGIHPSDNTKNPHLDAPEFDLESLDAIIISHAHMDHAGFLPYLYEYGYTGPVYLTAPTRDLMVMQQLDYIKLMQAENGKAPYTSKGIKNAIKHCIVVDYNQVTDITPDMRLTFQNAGHILGSAITHLHIGKGLHNILYTGDFKYGHTRLFDPASTNFTRVETLIMESTYGGKEDRTPPRREAEKRLLEIIKRTLERRGHVIIPSFAVGRAQEIMVLLADLYTKGELNAPVYLDGMIWDATAIHTCYPEFLSRNLQKMIFQQGNNPFECEAFKRVGSSQEREDVVNGEPSIILTTSGMLNGGPVIEYLRMLGGDERNSLVFVGYQAEGTLGRSIQQGWRDIPVRDGDQTRNMRLQLEVETVEGFGAHSDRSELLNYVRNLRAKPSMVLLNHGESSKITELGRAVRERHRIETRGPRNLDAVRLR